MSGMSGMSDMSGYVSPSRAITDTCSEVGSSIPSEVRGAFGIGEAHPASMKAAIAAMVPFSTSVTLVIGRFNAVPKQAHRMVRFCRRDCKTPTPPTDIKTRVVTFVASGCQDIMYATPRSNST